VRGWLCKNLSHFRQQLESISHRMSIINFYILHCTFSYSQLSQVISSRYRVTSTVLLSKSRKFWAQHLLKQNVISSLLHLEDTNSRITNSSLTSTWRSRIFQMRETKMVCLSHHGDMCMTTYMSSIDCSRIVSL
jgi:hypothetical protein